MTEKMKIIDFLRENQLDAIFVQKDENCRYLSKFTGSDSYLLLTKEELYLLTDSRYRAGKKRICRLYSGGLQRSSGRNSREACW